ncbi:MAG TPA: ribosomal L7Ae/L30e/S12e/Gadd45 family protein [bacterium]
MPEIERVLKILGFAQRAHKLTLGMDATLQAIKRGKIKAVVVAEDLSANARQKISTVANQINLPIHTCGSKAAFARALGREETGIIGIADAMFAKSFFEIFE